MPLALAPVTNFADGKAVLVGGNCEAVSLALAPATNFADGIAVIVGDNFEAVLLALDFLVGILITHGFLFTWPITVVHELRIAGPSPYPVRNGHCI